MLNIFKKNKTVENPDTNETSEVQPTVKTFEEYEREQKYQDDKKLEKCLEDMSDFHTLDKPDKVVCVNDANNNIIGKTNLKKLKVLFESNCIKKLSYKQIYFDKTYTGNNYSLYSLRIYMTEKGTVIFSNYPGTYFWTVTTTSKIQESISEISSRREKNKTGKCENTNIVKVNILTDNLSQDCRELYYYLMDI